jgi:hypothetical protein
MTDHNYVSYANVSPLTLKPNDAIALKVVAVAGYGKSWAAYMGLTDWDDDAVAESGDKLDRTAAERLFPQFPNAGWIWRP